MEEADVISLWETKKDSDILLTMGVNKWQLHENIIRGKGGLVDHILDNTGVQNGIRKIALKEHAFTASALESTFKYFYIGDCALDNKTEVVELLAVYDVSVTLDVSALQLLIVSRIGDLLRKILTSRVDLIDDFIIAADVILSEEAETWATMRQELQKAMSPHIVMLFSQEEFKNLVRTNLSFCFETLSATIAQMDITAKGVGKSENRHIIRDDDNNGVESRSSPTRISCNDAATNTDIPSEATIKGFDFTFVANNTDNTDAQPSFGDSKHRVAFEGKQNIAEEQSTTHVVSSPQASLGELKSPQGGTIIPSTNDSMSNSDASTHWESCSEGSTKSASRAEKSQASGSSNPVTIQTGASMSSTTSGYTVEQRPVASRAVERTRNPYALSRSSLSQTKEPTAANPFERSSCAYAFSGSSVPHDFDFSQTKQPASPTLFKRTSRGYSFTGSSLPRDFHFSGTTPTEQTKSTSTGTNPKSAQENVNPRTSSRNNKTRGSSPRKSGVKNATQLDPATAHQVKKGKLVVEPTKAFLTGLASNAILLENIHSGTRVLHYGATLKREFLLT
ncbi:hypothetical protein LZ32DRAFT_657115 [Colletotrichum eremochloae]|nr:hypothetical protein LZ32DRAFT_657115 [Colletotrichum eremochloae]